jgi:hypothetical protein
MNPMIYKIDITKAATAPNAAYIFRLMIAVNDLLTLKQIYESSKSSDASRPKHIRNSAIEYLLRMQQAHLFEAYDAFVTKIPTKGNSREKGESIANFVKQKPHLNAQLAKLNALKQDAIFKRIEAVRNNFSFHYNWDNEGQLTHEAILEFSNKDIEAVIHGPPGHKDFRYSIADEVLNVGWQNALITQHGDIEQTRDYITAMGNTFINFADNLIIAWIDEYKLAIK